MRLRPVAFLILYNLSNCFPTTCKASQKFVNRCMANEKRDWKISGTATSPKFGYCHPLPSILTLLVINSSEFEL